MLDVIGAGATATSKTNWHNVWILSNECKALEDQLQKILYDCVRDARIRGYYTDSAVAAL